MWPAQLSRRQVSKVRQPVLAALAALAVLLGLGLAGPPAQAAGTGRLDGIVWGPDGQPAAWVPVQGFRDGVADWTTTTNDEGYFEAYALTSGSYQVRAHQVAPAGVAGVQPGASAIVAVVDDQLVSADVHLPALVPVDLRLVRSGALVPGFPPAAAGAGTGSVTPDGGAPLAVVGDGRYLLAAGSRYASTFTPSTPGYGPTALGFTTAPAGSAARTVQLEVSPTGSTNTRITGRLVWHHSGAGYAMQVTAIPDGQPWPGGSGVTVSTDIDGYFSLDVPQGRYRIRWGSFNAAEMFVGSSFFRHATVLTVGAQDLELGTRTVLPRTQVVVEGASVPEAIYLRVASFGEQPSIITNGVRSELTGGRMVYVFNGLPPGTYRPYQGTVLPGVGPAVGGRWRTTTSQSSTSVFQPNASPLIAFPNPTLGFTPGFAQQQFTAVLSMVEEPRDLALEGVGSGSLRALASGFHESPAAGASPVPTVRWQRLQAGTWTTVPGATATELTVGSGNLGTYRAVFTTGSETVTSREARVVATAADLLVPTNLRLADLRPTTATLRWDVPIGHDYTWFEVAVTAGGSTRTVVTTDPWASLTGLTPGVVHQISVRAVQSRAPRIAGTPVTLAVTTPGTVTAFVDVAPGVQFHDEILWLATQGVTTGWGVEPNREYRPLVPVARDAMAAFLYRLAGSPTYVPPAISPFVDVPTSNQFYKEISWLAAQGISTGWVLPGGAREFRPLLPVSRDAMAAFLHRFAGSPAHTAPLDHFTDVPAGAQFASEIAWLADRGISTGYDQGDGTWRYEPLRSVNRDAMAAFMYRLTLLG